MTSTEWEIGEKIGAQIVMRNEDFCHGENVYYANKKLFQQVAMGIVNELKLGQGYYIRIGNFESLAMDFGMTKVALQARLAPLYDKPLYLYTFTPPDRPAPTKIQQVVEGAADWLADEVLRRIWA